MDVLLTKVRVSAQNEWEANWSGVRVYVALNERLDQEAFKDLLLRFLIAFEGMNGRELSNEVYESIHNPRDRYQAWCTVVRAEEHGELVFVEWVRQVMPQAPEKFDDIGRMANEQGPEQSESPRRVPYPISQLEDNLY